MNKPAELKLEIVPAWIDGKADTPSGRFGDVFNPATGQVTKDRRKGPSHDGGAAMYFPLHWRELNTAKSPSLQHYLGL